MSIRTDVTATNNVDITNSNNKIPFHNFGRLIPQINFAAIRVKINLNNLTKESKDICDTAACFGL